MLVTYLLTQSTSCSSILLSLVCNFLLLLGSFLYWLVQKAVALVLDEGIVLACGS